MNLRFRTSITGWTGKKQKDLDATNLLGYTKQKTVCKVFESDWVGWDLFKKATLWDTSCHNILKACTDYFVLWKVVQVDSIVQKFLIIWLLRRQTFAWLRSPLYYKNVLILTLSPLAVRLFHNLTTEQYLVLLEVFSNSENILIFCPQKLQKVD